MLSIISPLIPFSRSLSGSMRILSTLLGNTNQVVFHWEELSSASPSRSFISKRLQMEHPNTSCPWEDILIFDMQRAIMDVLDPLNQRMCAMTCHSMRIACPQSAMDESMLSDPALLCDFYIEFGTP